MTLPVSPSCSENAHDHMFDHNSDHSKISYPGVVQPIERAVWDREAVGLSPTTRTKDPLKSAIPEDFAISLFIAVQDLSA